MSGGARLEDERRSVGGDDGVAGGWGRGGGHAALFVLVSLYVLCQVIAPHEPLGALGAHKLLLTWWWEQHAGRMRESVRKERN